METDRVGLGVEIAKHRGELRQHEQEEEQQHAAGGEQNERRIVQRIGELAARRFAARTLGAEHSRMW